MNVNTSTWGLTIAGTLAVTVLASLAKARENPDVYETHDVTGHHHPQGEALDDLEDSTSGSPDGGPQ